MLWHWNATLIFRGRKAGVAPTYIPSTNTTSQPPPPQPPHPHPTPPTQPPPQPLHHLPPTPKKDQNVEHDKNTFLQRYFTLTLKTISTETIHTWTSVASNGVSAGGVGMATVSVFFTLVHVWIWQWKFKKEKEKQNLEVRMAVPETDLVTSFNRTVKSYAEEYQFCGPRLAMFY